MCDEMPPKGSHDTPADMPRPITVEDLRRMASSFWRLHDPVLMRVPGMNPRHPQCNQQECLPEASASYRVSRSPKPSTNRYLTRKAVHGKAICPLKPTRSAHQANVAVTHCSAPPGQHS